MNWKIRLDRYLTTPPPDDSDFFEAIEGDFANEFWTENLEWIEEQDGQFEKWGYQLMDKPTKRIAQIIERAFKIYKL